MVTVVVIGSRLIRYRVGCCGSRSMEEAVQNYMANLYRRFGQKSLRCVYVDVNDPEAAQYSRFLKDIKETSVELPLVLVDDTVVSRGRSALYKLPEVLEQLLSRQGSPLGGS